MNVIRIPFVLERMQKYPGGPLVYSELARLDVVVNHTTNVKGMYLFLLLFSFYFLIFFIIFIIIIHSLFLFICFFIIIIFLFLLFTLFFLLLFLIIGFDGEKVCIA